MIEVVVKRQAEAIIELNVSGHALAGEPGQDLVCAGASAIMFGALNSLDQLTADQCQLQVKPNQISIKVRKQSAELALLLESLLIQLQTMQVSNQAYMTITQEVLA